MLSIMNAVASRGKGKKGSIPKLKELYDRNSERKDLDVEDVIAKQEEAMSWLSGKQIINK